MRCVLGRWLSATANDMLLEVHLIEIVSLRLTRNDRLRAMSCSDDHNDKHMSYVALPPSVCANHALNPSAKPMSPETQNLTQIETRPSHNMTSPHSGCAASPTFKNGLLPTMNVLSFAIPQRRCFYTSRISTTSVSRKSNFLRSSHPRSSIPCSSHTPSPPWSKNTPSNPTSHPTSPRHPQTSLRTSHPAPLPRPPASPGKTATAPTCAPAGPSRSPATASRTSTTACVCAASA